MSTPPGGAERAPFDLDRFIIAQAGAFEDACAELRSGRKISHWMWFVFPQMLGLGRSALAERYAIRSLTEARAYLEHPLLGARLAEVTRLVIALRGRSLVEIFGSPDDMKFRSNMTLFAAAAGPGSIYGEALDLMCGGERDTATLALLGMR